MNYQSTPKGDQTRYDVSFAENTMTDRQVSYTRFAETPAAATQSEGAWTYQSDMSYGLTKNEFTITVMLPEGAELVSAEPKPALEFKSNGRTAVRLQGTRLQNEKFEFELRYRLAADTRD